MSSADIGTNVIFKKQLGLNYEIDQKYVGLKMKENNVLSFNSGIILLNISILFLVVNTILSKYLYLFNNTFFILLDISVKLFCTYIIFLLALTDADTISI